MTPSLKLASFKLQFVDERIRIVPAIGLDGCPFAGPGIDLVGAATGPLFALAEPLITWLNAREPGIALRSLSIDLRTGRVLVTYTQPDGPAEARPQALRVDAPASSELIDGAKALIAALSERAATKLASRR